MFYLFYSVKLECRKFEKKTDKLNLLIVDYIAVQHVFLSYKVHCMKNKQNLKKDSPEIHGCF